jgi:hypothetical protein
VELSATVTDAAPAAEAARMKQAEAANMKQAEAASMEQIDASNTFMTAALRA